MSEVITMADVDDYLELKHAGVKGMRWGKRKPENLVGNKPTLSRKAVRQDKKWAKGHSKAAFEAYDAVASKMNNGGIQKFNNQAKYKNVDFSDKKNAKAFKSYLDDYSKFFTKELNAHAASTGINISPSGTKKMSFEWDIQTDGFPAWRVEER